MNIKSLRHLILFIGLLGVLRVLAACAGGSSGEGAVSSPTGLGTALLDSPASDRGWRVRSRAQQFVGCRDLQRSQMVR
jgi:hypothetical protein